MYCFCCPTKCSLDPRNFEIKLVELIVMAKIWTKSSKVMFSSIFVNDNVSKEYALENGWNSFKIKDYFEGDDKQ